ncbi:MAG: hypothetical protein K2L50_00665 [Bacteroidales bacterium]|nr:hypothetical protein [Bacteroidales bacterium]
MKPTFTQPCFIRKNTPELRKKLENLGYKVMLNEETYRDPKLYAHYGYVFIIPGIDPDAIDCGENEDLFLAVAALRDDSDYMQWFCDNVCFWNKRFILCKEEEFKIYFNKVTNGDCGSYKDFHKATVDELIENFNNKPNKTKKICQQVTRL